MRRLTAYEKSISIEGPVGNLEAIWGEPEQETAAKIPQTFAIICHPHPLHGGTMNNKVVTTMGRGLHNLGLHTIRFNYRGVEESDGEYGEGVGEIEDTVAVIDWIHIHYPDARIVLTGFSFGAYISLCIASELKPAPLFLLTVAPVVTHPAFEKIGSVHCPWLLLVGDNDKLISADDTATWVKRHPTPPELILFENCSHFFHGKLTELRETLEARLAGFL